VRISDINWIPITGKPTKCFGKLSSNSADKHVLLLDPKFLSEGHISYYSTVRRPDIISNVIVMG